MACGGKTFFAKDGYKYFSPSSVSYTIPQVSAMFTLAKQINKDILFQEFVNIVRGYSKQVDGRFILSPNKMFQK